MRRQALTAVLLLAVLAVLTGLVYPLVVFGIGQAAFGHQVNGSFVTRNGVVVGSSLLGQNFFDAKGNPLPQYFQPRPSDTSTSPYNAAAARRRTSARGIRAWSASNPDSTRST